MICYIFILRKQKKNKDNFEFILEEIQREKNTTFILFDFVVVFGELHKIEPLFNLDYILKISSLSLSLSLSLSFFECYINNNNNNNNIFAISL